MAAHSSTSVQPASPVPAYPAGHMPQVREPAVFMQVTSGSQPPLLAAHSSTSVHPTTPSPAYPAGHAPHTAPPAPAVHITRGSQPPLLTAQGSPASGAPESGTVPASAFPAASGIPVGPPASAVPPLPPATGASTPPPPAPPASAVPVPVLASGATLASAGTLVPPPEPQATSRLKEQRIRRVGRARRASEKGSRPCRAGVNERDRAARSCLGAKHAPGIVCLRHGLEPRHGQTLDLTRWACVLRALAGRSETQRCRS